MAQVEQVKVEPVVGDSFRRAMEVKLDGRKRKQLFLLLAAFRDADPDYSPSANELCSRVPGRRIEAFDGVLARLEDVGLVEVDRDPEQRRRSRYALRLP
jgi:predicted transcriptional regulator